MLTSTTTVCPDLNGKIFIDLINASSYEELLTCLQGRYDCENLNVLLENLINTSSCILAPTKVREAYRSLTQKISIPNPLFYMAFLRCLLITASKSIRINSLAFDFLPLIVQYLIDRKRIPILSNGILGALSQLCDQPLHFENILEFIVSLKESKILLPEKSVVSILKKLEDVPLKLMPAAIYQSLLWCRENYLFNCFETIFAVLEVKASELDISECLNHIKMALSHESKIALIFKKYLRALLKSDSDVSPLILLLALRWSPYQTDTIDMIKSYFVRLAEFHSKLRTLPSIPGLASDDKPQVNKLVNQMVMRSINSEEEEMVLSLIELAVDLITIRNRTDIGQVTLVKSGIKMLLDIFKGLPVARLEILNIIVDKLLLSSNYNKAITTPIMIEILGLLGDTCSIDQGKTLQEFINLSNNSKSFLTILERNIERCPWELICSLPFGEDTLSDFSNLLSIRILSDLIKNEKLPLNHHVLIFSQFHCKNFGDSVLRYFYVRDILPKYYSILSEIAFFYFKYYFDNENLTQWNSLIFKIARHESIMITLSLMLKCSHYEFGESERIKGFFNCLVEFLLNEVSFPIFDLGPDDQNKARNFIHFLFDISLCYVANSKELSERSIVEATDKLVSQLQKFSSRFPTPLLKEVSVLDSATLTKILSACLNCNSSRWNFILEGIIKRPMVIEGDLEDFAMTLLKSIHQLALLEENPDKRHLLISCIDKLCTLKCRVCYPEIKAPLQKFVSQHYLPPKSISKLCDCLHSVELEDIFKTYICTNDQEVSASKSILSLILLNSQNNDSNLIQSICKDIAIVVGKVDPNSSEQPRRSLIWKSISSRSVDGLLGVILEFLEDKIQKIEWISQNCQSICKSSILKGNSIINYLSLQYLWITESLCELSTSVIQGVNYGRFMNILQFSFKVAVKISKLLSISRIPLPTSFIGLANFMAVELTKKLYTIIPIIQQTELENYKENSDSKKKQKYTKKLKSQLWKESRLIPSLIFQIESFEREILSLSDLHKTKIVKSFHRSTARDFRIQLPELEAALEQNQPIHDSNTTTNGSESENENLVEATEMSLVISNYDQ